MVVGVAGSVAPYVIWSLAVTVKGAGVVVTVNETGGAAV